MKAVHLRLIPIAVALTIIACYLILRSHDKTRIPKLNEIDGEWVVIAPPATPPATLIIDNMRIIKKGEGLVCEIISIARQSFHNNESLEVLLRAMGEENPTKWYFVAPTKETLIIERDPQKIGDDGLILKEQALILKRSAALLRE